MSDNMLADFLQVCSNTVSLRPLNIPTALPTVVPRDRERGEITRYFVRFTTHTAPADISEVDKITYRTVIRNPLYTGVEVRWTIGGPREDVYGLPNVNTPVRLVTGVETANRISVDLANEDMPGLSDYITDYTRFWEE